MKPDVSIIIATYNRAGCLRETMRSLLRALEGHPASVEVIVVDNNSSDDTGEVVSQFSVGAWSTRLRLVRETRQGLSWARNRGLCEAAGEFICFLDDDVDVTGPWLSGIMEAFRIADDIGAVAGRIELAWEKQPGPLLNDPHYLPLFSRYYQGEETKVLARGDEFFGANFALRREAAAKTGYFNTLLGRKKTCLLSGEETDYAQRIWRNGYRIAYSGKSLVYHRVPAERACYRWLLRRFFWGGVSARFIPGNHYPFYSLKKSLKALENIIILVLSISLLRKKRIVRCIFHLSECLGYAYGLCLGRPALDAAGDGRSPG